MRRATSIGLFISLIIFCLLPQCSRTNNRLNVILISIDTLRPDHLGCYGYERSTSPAVDRLAQDGVCFENVFSSTTWTLPSHLALLTSLPDLVHGVLSEATLLDENRTTLAEQLKQHGYRTYGVFTAPFLLPRWGFSQGFDNYVDATLFDKRLDGAEMLNASERGRTTPGAIEKAKMLLEKEPGKPFFLFLHLFDAHPDFDPPSPYDSMFDPDYIGNISGIDIMNNPGINKDMSTQDLTHLKALYDGEIRFVDQEGIAKLLSYLTEQSLLENTLIIITSDHGEEFFEHGVFGHRQNLFDTTLRIPLILWCPQMIPAGKRIREQARIIDIMPTILDLLDLPQSPEGLGKSLVPAINEIDLREMGAPVFAEVQSGTIYMECLRTDQDKFIRNYKIEERNYYVLESDPEERSPLKDPEDPGFRSAMEKYFSVRWALTSYKKTLSWGATKAPEMDPELRERLKSLGYLK